MLTTTFEWHPHTEEPKGVIASVILAIPDPEDKDGVAIIIGLFDWMHGQLESSDLGMDVPDAPFFWAYEQDMLSGLQARFHRKETDDVV